MRNKERRMKERVIKKFKKEKKKIFKNKIKRMNMDIKEMNNHKIILDLKSLKKGL